MTETTRVVFRKYPGSGEIIALFPDTPSSEGQSDCLAYVHLGQHCAATYDYIIDETEEATPEEYADLLHELINLAEYSPDELVIVSADDVDVEAEQE